MHPPTSSTDDLYAKFQASVDGFRFDDNVVTVFSDTSSSVPGYRTIVDMIGQIAERYAQHDTHCYDLGCLWARHTGHAPWHR